MIERSVCRALGCIFWLLPLFAWSQKAVVSGVVTDSLGVPVPLVAVFWEEGNTGAQTNPEGFYRLEIPAGRSVTLVARHNNYSMQVREFHLEPGTSVRWDFTLREQVRYLRDVEIAAPLQGRFREEAGSIDINPRALQAIPTPFLDFNQALISSGALGIVGNNELSASYAVRGGNFDENLVYVDNIQVYRPFLVRAGEQEGLSFINPDLVAGVEFSSGGWQPKYGDKLSSVLNVTYKKPQRKAGSLTVGLLGGSLHAEGVSKDGKLSWVSGARHKTTRYLLNTLDTDGEYLPRFTDWQTYLAYDLSGKGKKGVTTLSWLSQFAVNRYELTPVSRSTTFGTFQQTLRLNVLFVGAEELAYRTLQQGLKLTHQLSDRWETSLIASGVITREQEFINVEGGYFLCDVNTNFGEADFGDCIFIRGTGSQFRYARNLLDANLYALESRNTYRLSDQSFLEFGLRFDHERITDFLNEYTFLDSADFVQLDERIFGETRLISGRLAAYAQASHRFSEQHVVTWGLRANYWSVNGQWLLSPRLQYAFRPAWRADIVFRLAMGLYQQPPFYREMRDFAGSLNLGLRAQQATHAIAGFDWGFMGWGRPFKLIAEMYHKYLWDVVPYDIDNVRLRYYANNNATAQVAGMDFRLSGEFIPGTESWFNLSLLSAREFIPGDGRGAVRRPSDQRVTLGFFFQDHLPNDPSIRVYIRTLYGSGLPYGPPNSPQFRQALSASSQYLRSDIGFSKIFQLKKPENKQPGIQTLWVGLDVLNLFGVNNNISFNWIPDFFGNQYAVPNTLSQRFFNARMVLRYH